VLDRVELGPAPLRHVLCVPQPQVLRPFEPQVVLEGRGT